MRIKSHKQCLINIGLEWPATLQTPTQESCSIYYFLRSISPTVMCLLFVTRVCRPTLLLCCCFYSPLPLPSSPPHTHIHTHTLYPCLEPILTIGIRRTINRVIIIIIFIIIIIRNMPSWDSNRINLQSWLPESMKLGSDRRGRVSFRVIPLP